MSIFQHERISNKGLTAIKLVLFVAAADLAVCATLIVDQASAPVTGVLGALGCEPQASQRGAWHELTIASSFAARSRVYYIAGAGLNRKD